MIEDISPSARRAFLRSESASSGQNTDITRLPSKTSDHSQPLHHSFTDAGDSEKMHDSRKSDTHDSYSQMVNYDESKSSRRRMDEESEKNFIKKPVVILNKRVKQRNEIICSPISVPKEILTETREYIGDSLKRLRRRVPPLIPDSTTNKSYSPPTKRYPKKEEEVGTRSTEFILGSDKSRIINKYEEHINENTSSVSPEMRNTNHLRLTQERNDFDKRGFQTYRNSTSNIGVNRTRNKSQSPIGNKFDDCYYKNGIRNCHSRSHSKGSHSMRSFIRRSNSREKEREEGEERRRDDSEDITVMYNKTRNNESMHQRHEMTRKDICYLKEDDTRSRIDRISKYSGIHPEKEERHFPPIKDYSVNGQRIQSNAKRSYCELEDEKTYTKCSGTSSGNIINRDIRGSRICRESPHRNNLPIHDKDVSIPQSSEFAFHDSEKEIPPNGGRITLRRRIDDSSEGGGRRLHRLSSIDTLRSEKISIKEKSDGYQIRDTVVSSSKTSRHEIDSLSERSCFYKESRAPDFRGNMKSHTIINNSASMNRRERSYGKCDISSFGYTRVVEEGTGSTESHRIYPVKCHHRKSPSHCRPPIRGSQYFDDEPTRGDLRSSYNFDKDINPNKSNDRIRVNSREVRSYSPNKNENKEIENINSSCYPTSVKHVTTGRLLNSSSYASSRISKDRPKLEVSGSIRRSVGNSMKTFSKDSGERIAKNRDIDSNVPVNRRSSGMYYKRSSYDYDFDGNSGNTDLKERDILDHGKSVIRERSRRVYSREGSRSPLHTNTDTDEKHQEMHRCEKETGFHRLSDSHHSLNLKENVKRREDSKFKFKGISRSRSSCEQMSKRTKTRKRSLTQSEKKKTEENDKRRSEKMKNKEYNARRSTTDFTVNLSDIISNDKEDDNEREDCRGLREMYHTKIEKCKEVTLDKTPLMYTSPKRESKRFYTEDIVAEPKIIKSNSTNQSTCSVNSDVETKNVQEINGNQVGLVIDEISDICISPIKEEVVDNRIGTISPSQEMTQLPPVEQLSRFLLDVASLLGLHIEVRITALSTLNRVVTILYENYKAGGKGCLNLTGHKSNSTFQGVEMSHRTDILIDEEKAKESKESLFPRSLAAAMPILVLSCLILTCKVYEEYVTESVLERGVLWCTERIKVKSNQKSKDKTSSHCTDYPRTPNQTSSNNDPNDIVSLSSHVIKSTSVKSAHVTKQLNNSLNHLNPKIVQNKQDISAPHPLITKAVIDAGIITLIGQSPNHSTITYEHLRYLRNSIREEVIALESLWVLRLIGENLKLKTTPLTSLNKILSVCWSSQLITERSDLHRLREASLIILQEIYVAGLSERYGATCLTFTAISISWILFIGVPLEVAECTAPKSTLTTKAELAPCGNLQTKLSENINREKDVINGNTPKNLKEFSHYLFTLHGGMNKMINPLESNSACKSIKSNNEIVNNSGLINSDTTLDEDGWCETLTNIQKFYSTIFFLTPLEEEKSNGDFKYPVSFPFQFPIEEEKTLFPSHASLIVERIQQRFELQRAVVECMKVAIGLIMIDKC